MERYGILVEYRFSWNHANLRPEANMMGIHCNTVVLQKRKLDVRESK